MDAGQDEATTTTDGTGPSGAGDGVVAGAGRRLVTGAVAAVAVLGVLGIGVAGVGALTGGPAPERVRLVAPTTESTSTTTSTTSTVVGTVPAPTVVDTTIAPTTGGAEPPEVESEHGVEPEHATTTAGTASSPSTHHDDDDAAEVEHEGESHDSPTSGVEDHHGDRPGPSTNSTSSGSSGSGSSGPSDGSGHGGGHD